MTGFPIFDASATTTSSTLLISFSPSTEYVSVILIFLPTKNALTGPVTVIHPLSCFSSALNGIPFSVAAATVSSPSDSIDRSSNFCPYWSTAAKNTSNEGCPAGTRSFRQANPSKLLCFFSADATVSSSIGFPARSDKPFMLIS